MGGPFDILRDISKMQTPLLFVCSALITTFSILLSNTKSQSFRVTVLFLLMILSFLAGSGAEVLFNNFNSRHLYDEYFINLTIEYFSALFITPFIFLGLIVEKENKTLITVVWIFVSVCFLYAVACACFKIDIQSLSIPNAILKPYYETFNRIFENICVEILSLLPAALILLAYSSFQLIYKTIFVVPDSLFRKTIVLLIICLVAEVICIFILHFTGNFQGIDEEIVIAIISAILSTIVISDVIVFNAKMFWVIALITIIFVGDILLSIDGYSILFKDLPLSQGGVVTLSAELVGGLCCGALLQRMNHK
jgi:hypothetical protein